MPTHWRTFRFLRAAGWSVELCEFFGVKVIGGILASEIAEESLRLFGVVIPECHDGKKKPGERK